MEEEVRLGQIILKDVARTGIPVAYRHLFKTADTKRMTLDVVTLLAELFPAEWGAVEPSRVALRRLSGALTNAVYDVEAAPDVDGQRGPRLLLRLYGFGSDDFINRANEMSWLAALAAHGYGPRLLGAFMNGRCEQFLASRTMRKDDLVRPDLMAAVARNFCQLHAVQSRSLEKPTASEMWGQMRSWTEVTVEAWRHVIPTRNPQAYDQLVQAQLPWDQLEAESEFLQAALEGISDCLVFCHNDLQYGNIIQLLVGHDADGSPQYGDVILVDYEYAGINYAPYDIANHFCEFAADYHSDTPYRMDYSRYPTLAQQSFFIRTYLEAQDALRATIEAGGDADAASRFPMAMPADWPMDRRVAVFQRQVDRLTLASHFMWVLWGLMKSREADETFSYPGYTIERYREYQRKKAELYGPNATAASVKATLAEAGATPASAAAAGL